MDPNVDQSLRTPDRLAWIWPALSPDQRNTVTMRGQVIATRPGRSLIAYKGRLYEQSGASVTVWGGEAYAQR